jgi:hypothetical protein
MELNGKNNFKVYADDVNLLVENTNNMNRNTGIILYVSKGVFPRGKSGWGVKLTTHPHLVPRSKNAWSYTSTPPIHIHGMVLS